MGEELIGGKDRPEILASSSGLWPGEDPRQAASGAFAALAMGYPPVPWTGVAREVRGTPRGGTGTGTLAGTRAAAGTGGATGSGPGSRGADSGSSAWMIDPIGTALALCDGLSADLGSFGWRLTLSSQGSRDRDLARVESLLARTLEACEEYGTGFAGRTMLTLPGPWALLRRLGLPGGNPALADAGARRDVVQAYALGASALLDRYERALGTRPRVRLVEPDLDELLTGRVPTVSGYRALPAVPDSQVTAALRSFIGRTGEDTILTLPGLSTVTIRGKAIAHASLAADAGVTALAVPLPAGDAEAVLRPWEAIAGAHESGTQMWVRLPASAGLCAGRVRTWLEAVSVPWHRLGMNPHDLTGVGVLTGIEPVAAGRFGPVRAVPDDPGYGAAQFALAAHLGQAVREEHE